MEAMNWRPTKIDPIEDTETGGDDGNYGLIGCPTKIDPIEDTETWNHRKI